MKFLNNDRQSPKSKVRTITAIVLSLLILPTSLPAADRRDNPSPYGVLAFLDWNHDWNNFQYDSMEKVERDIQLMKKAKVGFVRQAFPWNIIEPQEGQFEFERYDDIVALMKKNKIAVLGTLSYTAEWTGRAWNDAPDPDLFVGYVKATVSRYKDSIKYWEIWNEPDQPTYWKNQDRMVGYTRLLKKIYPVIKEIDPTAVVVLGSVNTPFPLKQMYRNGAQGHFDVVNVHPFVNPLFPHPLERLKGIYTGVRQSMVQYGDKNKPIWFTEVGCPGVAHPEHEKGWWEGVPPSEEQQAKWVTSIYEEPLRWPGVQKIFWAFFRDTNSFGDGVDYFGLVRQDYSLKPAYDAFRRAARSR